ncbi:MULTISPECIES: M10 family metallopeptidase C-terminal domain-containing protein [Pseudomonas fluorescens group]|uniref:AprA_3 protein n=1 Tax=Pseudomonas fluorescens TaxID=294 RepID=A0A0D0RK85_PSEFL|nr:MULTISPECIES: M10 family metallopeptidase C-terminal domain-containing protein [Pseudomonas fluorescens group]AZE61521.1 Secreted alkaline metalloproteinase [Pseudomonas synxantha]KIR19897.1 Serralysin precursor [Pseudomonas fluorescens]
MPSTVSHAPMHLHRQIQPPAGDSPLPGSLSVSDKAAQQLTRDNFKLKDKNGDGQLSVSYKFFDATDSQTAWLKGGGALEFSQARKKAFRSAIKAWEDVVKVKFTENAKHADAFFVLHANNGVGGYATLPNDQGTANIGIGVGNRNSPPHSSMIHELGHSLGLQHPNQNYPENSQTHTAMSYKNKWWRPADERGVSVSDSNLTPAMHDIAAVQRLYEPNYETRKGNTTYGFNSNTERDHYTLTSADELTNFCVWDGGGEDTLDFSGFKQNQKINLGAETLSDVGGRLGNVSIAKGVVMENAIGGSGHDVLIGNHVNNRMTGGAGGDTLTGGGGADTFVYNRASDSPAENPDTLTDFTSGIDKIDLSGLLKKAGLQTPQLVDQHTGRKGELTLDYDANIKLYRLILNVNGDPGSALVILSKSPIKPGDILTGATPDIPVTPDATVTPVVPPQPEPEPAPIPPPKPTPAPPPPVTPPPSGCDTADTVYGFNANTDRRETSLSSPTDQPVFSVHDLKGNDTLDFSGFAQAQRINLAPNSRSSVGGLTDNVYITPDTLIENAIGGKGNDRIAGNSGDNVLIGGGGADHLAGNGGFNTFTYQAASDSTRDNPDLLMDFTTGQDKIDLSSLSKNTQVTFNHVSQYSGRPGDTLLTFNPNTHRYFLAIDLTGDCKTDFLIKSTRPIYSEDVIGLNIRDDGYL